MTPATASLDPRTFLRNLLEQAHALVPLLPALLMLWPGERSPLEGDPFPIPSATGIAAVCATIGVAFLITRRVRPTSRWIVAYLGFLVVGALANWRVAPSDTFSASRALMLAGASLAAFAGGASLGEHGWRALARALVLLVPYAVLPALFDGAHNFSGPLGNTGSTSEVALLGAAAGAWLALSGDGLWKWLGAAATGLYAFYVGVAPVLAGAACLAVLLVVLVATMKDTRKLGIVLAGLCALLFFAGRFVPHRPQPASPRPAELAPGDVGGVAVRKFVWGSLPALIVDYGPLGAGLGQFQAAYPPYRDPQEIEQSSHGRTLPAAETEVEHAHSDLAQGFVEAGWLGGALWLVFLGAAGFAALRLLRDPFETSRAPLGAVAIAVLANAALREPLLWNPVSAVAAFGVFGVLLASPATPVPEGPRGWLRSALVGIAIVFVAPQIAGGWTMALHGRALAKAVSSNNADFAAFALESCEDSPVALAMRAREREAKAGSTPSEEVAEAWRAVLAVRPHNLEALVQLGIACARLERVDEARASWNHALSLDPGHPALRFNLARVEALLGDVDASVVQLEAAKQDVAAALRGFGFAALREARFERGLELLGRADEKYAGIGPEMAFELARDPATGNEDDRLALEGAAHVLWARQHGANGAPEDAVRSYRQAKRCLTPRDGRALPGTLSLELAAALAASGKVEDARKELGQRGLEARELSRLPEWAGQALFENGLLAR